MTNISIVGLLVLTITLLLLEIQCFVYGAVKLFIELRVKPSLDEMDIFK